MTTAERRLAAYRSFYVQRLMQRAAILLTYGRYFADCRSLFTIYGIL